MKIFNIPINHFGTPFNKWWKRVIAHFLIGLVVSTIVCFLAYPDFSLFFELAFLYFFSDIFQAFTHMVIYFKLQERYDWIRDTQKRAFYGIALHTLGTFAIFFTIPLIYLHLVFHISFTEAFNILLDFWLVPISIVGFVMVFAVAGEFFKNWKRSLASEEKLKAEMMSYKYESLRNQINPHFLLDSFVSLKNLINESPNKAAGFIQKISDLYRHVLEVKDKEFISLKDELTFISPYVELLQSRYGEKVKIKINIKPGEDDLIAPLTLQFLIENAVENSILKNGKPLTIELNKNGEYIEVSNTHDHSKQEFNLNGSGLKNIQQQYQFYSKTPVEFVESAQVFLVKLPILKGA